MSDETNGNVTYTVKEMIASVDAKIDGLAAEIKALGHNFATLPVVYVTQAEMKEARSDARTAKRFAITATLMSIGALGTFIGLIV